MAFPHSAPRASDAGSRRRPGRREATAAHPAGERSGRLCSVHARRCRVALGAAGLTHHWGWALAGPRSGACLGSEGNEQRAKSQPDGEPAGPCLRGLPPPSHARTHATHAHTCPHTCPHTRAACTHMHTHARTRTHTLSREMWACAEGIRASETGLSKQRRTREEVPQP